MPSMPVVLFRAALLAGLTAIPPLALLGLPATSVVFTINAIAALLALAPQMRSYAAAPSWPAPAMLALLAIPLIGLISSLWSIMPGESATMEGAAPGLPSGSHGSARDAVLASLSELPANGGGVAVLAQLEILLACDDTAVGELFEANRALLLARFGAGEMQLARQIGDFDYPAALATLRDLMRQAPT